MAVSGGILHAIRMARQTLTEIQRDDRPRLGEPIIRVNGQLAVRVFPRDRWDRLLFGGVSGDVWMQPGVTAEELLHTQARVYRETCQEQRVTLVLGAGNASMLLVIDVLHKLLVENQVVVLKPNPVNGYLGLLMEDGLRAFIRRGFLRIVYGEVAEAQYLCNHPLVDELHLTGSQQTFEMRRGSLASVLTCGSSEQHHLIVTRRTSRPTILSADDRVDTRCIWFSSLSHGILR